MSLPENVSRSLSAQTFQRTGGDIEAALGRLGVTPSSTFIDFYKRYIGPFWSDKLGIEVADLVDDEGNVEALTLQCRRQYGFPQSILVLTELSSGGTVHALDTDSDSVFVVDFEGGDEALRNHELAPSWPTFAAFLQDCF